MLKIASTSGQEIVLTIYNAEGKLIRTDHLGIPENVVYDVDCKALSSGIFF